MSDTKKTIITPNASGELYVAGDYLTNLRYVFSRLSGGYAQVRFPKALCTKYQLASK